MNFNLPVRKKDSHKAQQGRVMVIGGSKKYYGAPILAALGAEHAGADLITLALPKIHEQTAKSYSLNFFVDTFSDGEGVTTADLVVLSRLAAECDALVIGNGMKVTSGNIAGIIRVLKEVHIPVVLDAGALQSEIIDSVKSRKSHCVITPHSREFERVFCTAASKQSIQRVASEKNLTICLKGMIDCIAGHNQFYENETGVPEMRVGGTGDGLAGIIASYIAQGIEPFKACCLAVYYYGKCGEKLAKQQKTFTALELIKSYPKLIIEV